MRRPLSFTGLARRLNIDDAISCILGFS